MDRPRLLALISLFMTPRTLLLLASFTAAAPIFAQDEPHVTKLLQKLKSVDVETRHEAMQALQTSLDPRIPEACLSALQSDGESIRRLAARAIGSRWHQIPKERAPVFAQALKPHLQSEHEGLVNMARRGIALLNRDYRDAMLSRSKSKRWVIYERHGLPCVIDTENSTEELLGHPADETANFSAAWSNSEVVPATFWHPKQDKVALEIYEGRKTTTVWIWRPGPGLRKLSETVIIKALGHREEDIARFAGFFVEIKGWKGDDLLLDLEYTTHKGEDLVLHDASLRWNAASDKIVVVSTEITN